MNSVAAAVHGTQSLEQTLLHELAEGSGHPSWHICHVQQLLCVIASSLGQNTGHPQVKTIEVYCSLGFAEISVHSQLGPMQNDMTDAMVEDKLLTS